MTPDEAVKVTGRWLTDREHYEQGRSRFPPNLNGEDIAAALVVLAHRPLPVAQLIEWGMALDDDPESPTCGRYFRLYRSSTPEPE